MAAVVAASELERHLDVFAGSARWDVSRSGEHLAERVEHVFARLSVVPSRADRSGTAGMVAVVHPFSARS
jgi:hypothetical protein